MPAPTCAPNAPRRRWLGQALAWAPMWLGGCAAPWPAVPAGDGSPSARRQLLAAAREQGLADWQGLQDLSLTLDDGWWPAHGLSAAGPQPLALRLLPQQGLLALGRGPAGPQRQQLLRDRRGGQLRLWQGDRAADDVRTRQTAALAADLHQLLLLGCIALADLAGPVNWAEPETLDGRRCDHLHLQLQPGLGDGSAGDQVSLFIDREQGWLRRLRVSLSGVGADARRPLQVDMTDHRRLHGLLWPGRWAASGQDGLPGRMPSAWRLLGLEANRGYTAADLVQAPWAGRAAAAPAPLNR